MWLSLKCSPEVLGFHLSNKKQKQNWPDVFFMINVVRFLLNIKGTQGNFLSLSLPLSFSHCKSLLTSFSVYAYFK